ncbi:uncharacterized protein LOC62_06G007834 [Vanrija pseudolonga]|uniref:Uncharacterized protein n=1 Tax=Vanrija pseudolonga TaxID=143232 RepID=A0AAF1BND9_9TREE|nr:hypothetical protein LOC62_06G007834 [Vanrija pseudolonga]
MSTYPVYYGTPAQRPRSVLSAGYRGVTIALGVICSLAALGYGLLLIAIQIMALTSYIPYQLRKASYSPTVIGIAWRFVVGILLVTVVAPIAIAAAVVAGRRAPSKPWAWVLTLIATILFIIINLGLRIGIWVILRCGSGYCNGIIVERLWAAPAGLAAGWLVFGIYFTIFFKKNRAEQSTAPVPVQQQPLMGQQYTYGAYGAPQPHPQAYPAAYPGYTPQPYPYATPYENRGLDEDKDSFKDNSAAYAAAPYAGR